MSAVEVAKESISVLAVELAESAAGAAVRQRLERDAIPLTVITLAGLGGAPPLVDVIIALSATPPIVSELALLVRWAQVGERPPRVLAVVPGAGLASSEACLEAGVDDVVVGEVSAREVVARVRALARRQRRGQSPSEGRVSFGRVTIDTQRHEVSVGGAAIVTTRHEANLLLALARARGQALTRQQLLDQVWGDEALDVAPRAVDNLICRLRRRMGEATLVVTVRGIGFRLSER